MANISKNHIYPYNWEYVISAFWNKYPNDFQPHVRRVDVINIDFDVNSKKLFTKRLFTLKYNAPKFFEKIIGTRLRGFAIEESECDFEKKEMIVKGSNYSFKSVFSIQEVCKFNVHPENSTWTLFAQDLLFKFNSFRNQSNPINKAFIKAITKSFDEKSHSGIKAMYFKIEQEIPTFREDNCNNDVSETLNAFEMDFDSSRLSYKFNIFKYLNNFL
ncbi:putative MSF1-like conserved region domain-containing protein [Cryptosporidium felis]|nr:putative MSF1-like conserved region domain-containing protein [Cryptosporidium felis]